VQYRINCIKLSLNKLIFSSFNCLFNYTTVTQPQRNNSALHGRRGSLPDVIKPKSIPATTTKQSTSFGKRIWERRPATCKPGSTRSKPVVSTKTTRRPSSALTKSTGPAAVNGLKQSNDESKAKSHSAKGFKPPSPPLEAFHDYSTWLYDAIKYLKNA